MRAATLVTMTGLLWLGAPPARADGNLTPRDCIAANEQSTRLRDQKKLRAARDQLVLCANPSCPGDIRRECAHGVDEVTAAIPSIVLTARDSNGNDLVAVRVTVDEAPLTSRLDGAAIQLDPGVHRFTFEATGKPRVERTIVLAEGQRERRVAVTFGAPSHAVQRVHDPGRRVAGLTIGVAGVLGVGLGIAASIVASVLWSNAQSECLVSGCGPASPAVRDHDAAKDWANVSTAAWIAGGVVMAIGGVVFFTAPWVAAGPSTGAGLSVGMHL